MVAVGVTVKVVVADTTGETVLVGVAVAAITDNEQSSR
jgi:hypothetical protein